MNEALPNTEFRQVQPSDGYEIDWATNGGTGNRDDNPFTRKTGNMYSSGNEVGIPQEIKFPFDLGADSQDNWTRNMPCDSYVPL
jgi:hypothetical protein